MSVLGIVFALTDIEIRGASVAKAPGERLCNYKNREYYTGCRVSKRTELAVSYEYLVYDIVKRATNCATPR